MRPQNVNIGCKKYTDRRISVFSFISSLKILFAIKPINMNKYIEVIVISVSISGVYKNHKNMSNYNFNIFYV